LLADADTAGGGEWFNALVLPGGRVGLVVAMWSGTMVAASAVMARRLGARLTSAAPVSGGWPARLR
jgi:hypothetical protein